MTCSKLSFSLANDALLHFLHPNALQRWRDKFLAEISALINSNLPDYDIFSRNKNAILFSLRTMARPTFPCFLP